MADSTEQWPTILDEQSFAYLVDLSQNLSKVEGLVHKLVKGNYQQWYKKNLISDQSSQNSTGDKNHSWDDSKNENKDNNKESQIHDWNSTNDGEASNDENNDTQLDWSEGWNTNFVDWSKFTSTNETSFNWDKPNLPERDNGWEISDPKEQKKQENWSAWDQTDNSGW